jgi:uncharacterized membrane protein YfcA
MRRRPGRLSFACAAMLACGALAGLLDGLIGVAVLLLAGAALLAWWGDRLNRGG